MEKSLDESLAHWAKFGGAGDCASDTQASRCEEALLLLAQRVRGLSAAQRKALDEREFLRCDWEAVGAANSQDANHAKRLWVQALLRLNAERDDRS